jgi:Rhodopirellula transposase DDE domain
VNDPTLIETMRQKYLALSPFLDERARRVWAATEAAALGRGGVTLVARATGMARSTIHAGQRDLKEPEAAWLARASGRTRRAGGGRKALTEQDPTLVDALEALVDPLARGDPESPLRWTTKSTRQLAAALGAQGHRISHVKVAALLKERGYRLQGTRKVQEGSSHPDRDAQFTYINAQAEAFQAEGQPVVSVDTKKKELVGPFRNGGREWQASGCPEEVRVHDFPDPELGKAIPYGVYDLGANEGWVSVGTDHDTAEFAVESLRRWWQQMGQERYPKATRLLITADSGGSNASQGRLWKQALQQWADEVGLAVTVCHFPPGTSKWNKIEHRLFSEITKNWRGRPLVSHEVIIDLIVSTRTQTGLQIRAALDEGKYPTGKKVSDREMAALALERASFQGHWNYTLHPRPAHQ